MGGALRRREAADRGAIATPSERVSAESKIASLAYLVWPVAVYDRIAPRPEASSWYRFHLRQALWFGNIAATVALLAFLWPLLLSFVVSSVVATIWIYAFAMLLDIALFVLWLITAMRYSQRAGRSELFDVPWISRVTGKPSQKS